MFLESSKKKGSIEVICGSMFSGKTEELIRRVKRAHFANLKVEIFKPLIDTRYQQNHIASHDENSLPSTAVNTAAEILLYAANAEVVAIDEAQFFDSGIVEVANQLANRGCRVIIAGLDMNYLGEPFDPMPHLMAVAEYVTKVHAICTKCGDLANHSHRTIGGDQLVLLGEKESYQPLCRECFNET